MSADLAQELLDAGKAVGLLKADGQPDPGWFSAPDSKLSTILSDASQRAAFLDLLDQLAPPAQIAGLPTGEKWHPLLAPSPRATFIFRSVTTATMSISGSR